eukprot:TRINITY_DN8352_c0_g2_i1.p1 TRINITY_DN8352_c0_g2~~TRINITY_DN8352_c0_g2_i1.p1  ORF type:complete len:269 (-),score=82.11 TRINITY_DN8352_c0_g2_i1:220-1026(-)
MFSKISLLLVLFAVVATQNNKVEVKVVGSANSENVVKTGEAVAEAIAKIEEACKKGDDINLVAMTEAKKVVEAAATATASGGIMIKSLGDAMGMGSTKASAQSKATAIAKAISTAIAAIANGPQINTATQAITEATETVTVKIQQEAIVDGQGEALAVAASSATAFVSAVAEALAAAAAKCEGEKGTVDGKVDSATSELPAFTEYVATFTNGAANIFGPGFATISKNTAEATSEGNTIPPLPAGTPPPSAIVPINSLLQNVWKQLGFM